MAISLTRRRKEDHGLRPLIPSRDLRGIADLIEEAFSHELDRSGQAALREMRWMGTWGVLLLWFDYFSPDVNTYLNGFVWVNHGKIVGNITVNRNAPEAKHWFISNVAVAKGHQRQGIAQALLLAAISFVEEMQGQAISLQVRQDNAPAIHLYEKVGFEQISGTSFLHMPRPHRVDLQPLPPGLFIRPNNLDVQDAYGAYAMARDTIPSKLQQEKPLRQISFRLGQEVIFNNFWRGLLGLGKAKYWVIEAAPGQFVATLHIEPGLWYTNHKITFMIHPDWWGKLEAPLISRALAYLSRLSPRPITFQHPAEHTTGIQTLRDFGFDVQRTHIWMKLML